MQNAPPPVLIRLTAGSRIRPLHAPVRATALSVPTRRDIEDLGDADLWDLSERAGEIREIADEVLDARLRRWVEVEGKTQAEIAEMVGRDQSRVSRRCAAIGVKPVSRRGRPIMRPHISDPGGGAAADAEVVDAEVVDAGPSLYGGEMKIGSSEMVEAVARWRDFEEVAPRDDEAVDEAVSRVQAGWPLSVVLKDYLANRDDAPTLGALVALRESVGLSPDAYIAFSVGTDALVREYAHLSARAQLDTALVLGLIVGLTARQLADEAGTEVARPS